MQSTHWLIHFLKKRKRNGLAQAVSNLVSELTLVGFIALLLTVLQGPISKICGEQGLPAVPRMKEGGGRCSEAACARGGAGVCAPRLPVLCSLPTNCFSTTLQCAHWQWHTGPIRTTFGRSSGSTLLHCILLLLPLPRLQPDCCLVGWLTRPASRPCLLVLLGARLCLKRTSAPHAVT